jgi:hypothetical protein
MLGGSAEMSGVSFSHNQRLSITRKPTANEHWTRSKKVEAEIEIHKPIKFQFSQSNYLFWQHLCCGNTFCCTTNLRKNRKLYNLYLDG